MRSSLFTELFQLKPGWDSILDIKVCASRFSFFECDATVLNCIDREYFIFKGILGEQIL